MRKAGFAMQAQRQDSPRHPDRGLGRFKSRSVGRGILFDQLGGGSGPFKLVRICFVTASFDVGKLLLTLEILVLWLKR